jgi:hypothetical protein
MTPLRLLLSSVFLAGIVAGCTESVPKQFASERMTLTGVYECLPHRDTSGPQTMECALGMKTDDGNHYAIDLNLLETTAPNLQTGDRFTANGLMTPIEMLSSDHWQKYDVTGIFSITDSIKKL